MKNVHILKILEELDRQLLIIFENQENITPIVLFHSISKWINEISIAIINAESVGIKKTDIRLALKNSREIHGHSSWISRLQLWPNGYQGDYDTIEKMLSGVTNTNKKNVHIIIEEIALNSAASQQHRNKVIFQEKKIRRVAKANGEILSIACGGSMDAFLALDTLLESSGRLVINDIDEHALKLSRNRLNCLGDRLEIISGNIIEIFRTKKMGKFDLILAGGLFDYLPEKLALFVIKSAVNRLKDGGEIFFTNILVGNPYRPWIEHLANWELIERSETEILELLHRAGVAQNCVQLERDQTGLALLVTVCP